jgi:hypothetical protein
MDTAKRQSIVMENRKSIGLVENMYQMKKEDFNQIHEKLIQKNDSTQDNIS